MKKITILLSLLIALSFSCDKKYKFYAFYIEKTIDVEFPTESVGDFENTQDVNLYTENVLETHGTTSNLIEEVIIEEVSLKQSDFTKFNTLDLFISAEGATEVSIAASDTINYSSDRALMNASNDKMDEYVKASTIKIKTTGQISTQQAQAFTVPVNLRFLVKSYVK